MRTKPILQLTAIVLAAVLLCLPCLLRGLPAGYNAPTHVKYQHHFAQQFWSGEAYPRWLIAENKGYGSPIFLAQYPLPYFATALLRPITSFPSDTREARELGLFVFLALSAAGVAAWLWLQTFTSPLAATLAAITYIALPYVLQDSVYARNSIGEELAFVWMPLAFLACESMFKRRSALFLLSGILALLIASNVITAMLFSPALVIYALVYARRSEPSFYRRALSVLVAQLLGAGMAAIYLVPLVAYRSLFDLRQMEKVLPGYQFGLYFLHMTSSDARSGVIIVAAATVILSAAAAGWGIWFSGVALRIRIAMVLIFVLAFITLVPDLGLRIVRLGGFRLRPGAVPPDGFLAAMLVGAFFTVILSFLAYSRIDQTNAGHRSSILLFLAASAFFLMLPFSAPLWKAAPGSLAIQFPYRVAGILCVAVVGLVAMAFDNPSPHQGPSRSLIALAAFATIVGGFLAGRTDRAFRHPSTAQFDLARDVDPMYRAFVPLPWLTAFANDMGTAPDSYHVDPTPGDGTLRSELVSGDCNVAVDSHGPRELAIHSDCTQRGLLKLGQLYSPLWKLIPDQGTSQSSPLGVSPDGLMQLTLLPGKQVTCLFFDMGPAERFGKVLSATSLLLGLVGFVYFRGRRDPGVRLAS